MPRLTVAVPKFVEIDNNRLGVLLLFLRLVVFVGIGYNLYNVKAYNTNWAPNAKATSLWAESGSYDEQAERDFATETGTRYDGLCNSADTWFDYHWSVDFVYENIVCRELPF